MAQYRLLLPKMGESVAEATITKWLKQPGDFVKADESVLEIATDKVDSEVPSPVSGKIIKHLFSEDSVAQVGDMIALIETNEPDAKNKNAVDETAPFTLKESVIDNTPSAINEEALPAISFLQKDAEKAFSVEFKATSKFYSPLVRSIAMEEGLTQQQLDQITGSGAEGRVTKQDILDYLQAASNGNSKVEDSETGSANSYSSPVSKLVVNSASLSGNDEIIEMDRMRRIIADHMVMSTRVAPHVTSFVEADVTNLVKWRERVKNSFEKREGEKITYTPVFIEAIAKALKDMPMVNVSVSGNQIIKKRDINIGMATSLPSGNLIVPVIKNADQLNLVGLAKAVNDLAGRARVNKLQPDDVKDGTFTLTNIGMFGNIMGTPIINQPQVAIMAVGVIKKKPAVMETEFGDVIAIRHMMYISMSYDHRVVDGGLGGSFIRKVADYLEAWDGDREI